MSGEKLDSTLEEGTDCPDTAAGHWSFFTTPDDNGSSFADEDLTSGYDISLDVDDAPEFCFLSAMIRRDEQGLNLCLTDTPDYVCSAEDLLRPQPAAPPSPQTSTPPH
ncbi:hypothetical protein [Streptomyces sp. NPDC055189]